jgi:ferredoxin, 2Fe-2S
MRQCSISAAAARPKLEQRFEFFYDAATPTDPACSMPTVIFIEHNGTRHEVNAANGASLMRAAVDNNVPGIDADCGGACACATCHVYVDADWLARTGTRTEMEESMLSFAAATQENSRLSCQIEMSDALAGIVLRLPEGQH